MSGTVGRSACVAVLFAIAGIARADIPSLVPCNDLPPAVVALGAGSAMEAFAVEPSASLAVAAMPSAGDEARSVLRFALGGAQPRDVRVPGRVLGLAIARDGEVAYAIVRQLDRKGQVRSVELWAVDLATARARFEALLPTGARGLAIGADGSTLLLAARDEIRTFRLPRLESGPLFRALGENVGVAAIEGSSTVILAQPSRVVLADLAAPQGRDGLELVPSADALAPLRSLVAVGGNLGPLALAADGATWCVRAERLATPPTPVPPPVPPPVPRPVASVPVETAPTEEPPPPSSAPEPPPAVPAPPAPPAPTEPITTPDAPTEDRTVFGRVEGPFVDQVAAVVFLGPDNVLHEASRAVPDAGGRFSVAGLAVGSYRLVAAGNAGRVLLCEPAFVVVRVGPTGAVEAPVLKVVRAQ